MVVHITTVVCVEFCECSYVYIGFFWVLWLPCIVQKHARRWIGYANLRLVSVCVCVCSALLWISIQSRLHSPALHPVPRIGPGATVKQDSSKNSNGIELMI